MFDRGVGKSSTELRGPIYGKYFQEIIFIHKFDLDQSIGVCHKMTCNKLMCYK